MYYIYTHWNINKSKIPIFPGYIAPGRAASAAAAALGEAERGGAAARGGSAERTRGAPAALKGHREGWGKDEDSMGLGGLRWIWMDLDWCLDDVRMILGWFWIIYSRFQHENRMEELWTVNGNMMEQLWTHMYIYIRVYIYIYRIELRSILV